MNEKQIEIINQAEKLFVKNGYDGTSIRDIAKEANINIAMISYYFGSKEKLLEAIFTHKIELFYEQMDESNFFKPEYNAFEVLEKFMTTFIRMMNLNAGLYQILAIEGNIKRRLLISPTFTKYKGYNLNLITRVIERGVKEKVFVNYDPVLIHATIMGTFMNFQMNRNFFSETLKIDNSEDYNKYIESSLTNHIHKTIKALLTYEE